VNVNGAGRQRRFGVGVALVLSSGLLAPADREPVTPRPPTTSATTSPISPTTTATTVTPTTTAPAATTTLVTPGTTSSTTSTTTSTTVAPYPAEVWRRFDDTIGGDLMRNGNRAVSVAVSRDGVLLHAVAFGARAPGEPVDPATSSDRFRIASISKVITAIVVLQLVDRGDLSLDQPVGQLLADITGIAPGDAAIPAITVRQLLSHTSGLPDYRSQFFGGRFHSCDEAIAYGLGRSLAHSPGTVHDYSNLNFCLLGTLIAHVTGRPYEAAVSELLLAPLGISGMRLVATVDPDPAEVVHDSGDDRTYMESLGGAGAWVATPSDLVRILDSLDPAGPGWHPLSPALAELMHQPLDVRYPEPAERRYGLGIIVWPDGSWGHTGTVENTHSMLVHRPDGATWCILVSGDHPSSTEDLRGVFDDAFAVSGLAAGFGRRPSATSP